MVYIKFPVVACYKVLVIQSEDLATFMHFHVDEMRPPSQLPQPDNRQIIPNAII